MVTMGVITHLFHSRLIEVTMSISSVRRIITADWEAKIERNSALNQENQESSYWKPQLPHPLVPAVVVQATNGLLATTAHQPAVISGVNLTRILLLYTLIPREVMKSITEGDFVGIHSLKPTFATKRDSTYEATKSGFQREAHKQKGLHDNSRVDQGKLSTCFGHHSPSPWTSADPTEPHRSGVNGSWGWWRLVIAWQAIPFSKVYGRISIWSYHAMAKPKLKQGSVHAQQHEVQALRGYSINYHVTSWQCTANQCYIATSASTVKRATQRSSEWMNKCLTAQFSTEMPFSA